MVRTVGNYFWLSVSQTSGAGRGECWRGCFLMTCAGGWLTLSYCDDMVGSAAMEGWGALAGEGLYFL